MLFSYYYGKIGEKMKKIFVSLPNVEHKTTNICVTRLLTNGKNCGEKTGKMNSQKYEQYGQQTAVTTMHGGVSM